MEKYPLPKKITKILSEWHRDGIHDEDCQACSSACCSHSGFGILENVILIFDKYQRGELIRTDYEFPSGLTFKEFIFKYFDIFTYSMGGLLDKKSFVMFFMRSLSDTNQLISMPEVGNYWQVRAALFQRNPWLNKGCIFLNKKVPNWPEDDKDSTRMCMLHTPGCTEMVTEKPIDCVFYTCTKPIVAKVSSQKISGQWLRALADSFLGSERRFKTMLEQDPGKRVD